VRHIHQGLVLRLLFYAPYQFTPSHIVVLTLRGLSISV